MRLDDLEESSNVEDRRGSAPVGKFAVGGGIGTIVIVILYSLLGGNPNDLKGMMPAGGSSTQVQSTPGSAPINDADKQAISKVLKETEKVWNQVLPEQVGKQYVEPKLVLFSGQVDSACGTADAAVGPFYCPGDSQVYIDLSFYDTMRDQLNADSDFARAYVIAHEVGHHVQNLLGTSHKVDQMRARLSGKDFNKISVRMELQADFLAGVWAHYATDLKIDRQDVEEAMRAADAIGDDKLQKQAQGYTVPDSFTHGTSAQRVKWFMKGFETGKLSEGDTFNTRNL